VSESEWNVDSLLADATVSGCLGTAPIISASDHGDLGKAVSGFDRTLTSEMNHASVGTIPVLAWRPDHLAAGAEVFTHSSLISLQF
jgi:hypothetical protein